jgi:hypothetical protein
MAYNKTYEIKNFYPNTLKFIIQEQTGISKQAGIFSEISKQAGGIFFET